MEAATLKWAIGNFLGPGQITSVVRCLGKKKTASAPRTYVDVWRKWTSENCEYEEEEEEEEGAKRWKPLVSGAVYKIVKKIVHYRRFVGSPTVYGLRV